MTTSTTAKVAADHFWKECKHNVIPFFRRLADCLNVHLQVQRRSHAASVRLFRPTAAHTQYEAVLHKQHHRQFYGLMPFVTSPPCGPLRQCKRIGTRSAAFSMRQPQSMWKKRGRGRVAYFRSGKARTACHERWKNQVGLSSVSHSLNFCQTCTSRKSTEDVRDATGCDILAGFIETVSKPVFSAFWHAISW